MSGNKKDLLLLSFITVGLGESIAQVLLIRELIVNFQGNELSLGVIFANWLLLTALGSGILGRWVDKFPKKPSLFSLTQILFFLILPLQILLSRSVNSLIGIEPGEMVPLLLIFYSSLLVLAPSCLLNGFQFALGCRLLSEEEISAIYIGRIYIAEAIGCMAGGVLFTYFLVYHFNPLQIALFSGLMNLITAILLLKPHSFSFFFTLFFLGGGIYLFSSQNINHLNEISRGWQWRNQKLVYQEDSIYGNITITKMDGQLNFYENGLLLFTAPYPDIAFNEELTHLSLLFHPSPKRVLLLGGGMGGVLKEIVKHNVEELNYVELDPLIINLARKFLPYEEDPRINLEYTDGRFFVKRKEKKYDGVIMNLPPPSNLQLNRFYTREFFQEVSKILTPSGIFSFGMPASESYMSEEMVRQNKCIFETLKEVFPEVLIIPGDFCIFVAFPSKGNIPPLEEIFHRFQERKLSTRLITLPYLYYKFSPKRAMYFLKKFSGEEVRINQDLQPLATFYNLSLWNVIFYPESRSFFQGIQRIKWWFFPFLLLSIFPFLFLLKKSNIISVIFAIITTGFFGLTFSIILVFSFQILYGYLYHKMGILISAFMLGLALGGYYMNYRMERIKENFKVLKKIETLIISYSFFLPFILMLLFTYSQEVSPFTEFLLYLLNCNTGFLVGLQFPLASRIYLAKEKRVGKSAGILYASDLLGAVMGAILVATFFIPLYGIIITCFLVFFLKIVSLGVLRIWGQISL